MWEFKFTKFQIAVHLGSLAPLAVLIWDFLNDNLTVNPIQAIEQRTGKTALVFLLLALTCTPLNTVFGFKRAIRVRRALGLYAFFYVALHFLTFLGLDYAFDPGLIYEAIFEKRYALVGFTAFLMLLPMAITSTKGWMRRLGQNWKRLHRLVYLAVPLVIVHYIWSLKADYRAPVEFALVLALLLLVRLPPVRRLFGDVRFRLGRQRIERRAETHSIVW